MGGFQAMQPLPGNEEWRFTSGFHVVPHDEGRQQACRSLQRFDPRHVCVGRAGAVSPCGHYYRWVFRCLELHVSTFLHPFAPPALPGFLATMGALTPGRPALRILFRDNEHRLWRCPGLPVFCHRTFRSFRLQPPSVVPTRFWGFCASSLPDHVAVAALVRGRASLGLHLSLAGSPQRSAESSSLALRTNRSPPVALHPASRRRSYRQLRSARTLRQGLAPC
jgi:hypothetical protein